MKKIKFAAKILTAAIAVVSLSFAALAADVKDISGHWSEEYVKYGIEQGYINGYPDGTFLPDKAVTRAEFAKMTNAVLGISKSEEIEFFDVEEDDWYYPEVGKALYAGYVTGYEDGSFRATHLITRQEAAVILSRIATRPETLQSVDTFADKADIADWAKNAFDFAYSKKFITGDDLGNLNPKATLTRGQAAKILHGLKTTENIVTGDYTISLDKAVCSETIFTDDIYFNATGNAPQLLLDGCTVLGKVHIATANDSTITVEDSDINNMVTEKAFAEISLTDDTSIKVLTLDAPANVSGESVGEVILSGSGLSAKTSYISADAKKVTVESDAVIKLDELANLVVADSVSLMIQGGSIENMSVSKNSKGSVITLATGASIENLTVDAAVSFMGAGKIESAVNNVSGVTYTVRPTKLNGVDGDEEDTGDDDDENGTTEAGYSFVPTTVYPENGEKDASTSTNVHLYFGSVIYDKDGEPATTDYIEEYIEIRRSTKSGTKISYEATLTSNSRILLEPDSYLQSGYKYYVVVPSGIFMDKDGDKNPELVYNFTVSGSNNDDDDDDIIGDITFSPKNASKNFDVNDDIKITFPSAIRRQNGSALTSSYLSGTAIELRQNSTNGTKVDITATINSSKRVVTVNPDEPLKPATKYYIIVTSGSLEYSSNGQDISRDYVYFTTSDAISMAVTPANAATAVAADSDIVLEFNSEIYRSSGSNITSTYLSEAIELRRSTANGTEVEFKAIISSDKKTITIMPYEALDANTKYYVIVKEGTLVNANDTENKKLTSYFTTAAVMAPSITPANGTENVKPSKSVTVSFSEEVYDNKGNPVTAEYILENDVITLRKGSSSGTKLDFTVSIDSEGKIITITPVKTFAANTTYYVYVTKSKLYNENKKANSAASSTFYTSYAEAPDFLPYDGETDVAVDTSIDITFESGVYQIGGAALTTTYLKNNVIELYKDSYDGESVDFSVTLSSDKQTFTIKPARKLEGETTYVVIVRASSLEDSNGEENIKYESSFKTAETVVTGCVFDPVSNAKNISVNASITATFNSSVYRLNGDKASNAYITNNVVEIRSGSSRGTLVNCTATISSDNKVITITPEKPFEANTKYYVNILSNKLAFYDGTAVAATSTYFTTGDGNMEVEVSDIGDTSAFVNVSAFSKGTLNLYYREKSSATNKTRVTGMNLSADAERKFELSDLKSKTIYVVTAEFTDEAGTTTKITKEFKTLESQEKKLEITGITVVDSNGYDYSADVVNGVCEIAIEKSTYVKLKVESSVANSEVVINDMNAIDAGEESGKITVTPGETAEIKVKLTSNDTEDSVECIVKISVHA